MVTTAMWKLPRQHKAEASRANIEDLNKILGSREEKLRGSCRLKGKLLGRSSFIGSVGLS